MSRNLADPELGTLYRFVRAAAGRSEFKLSFLHECFEDLEAWKRQGRAEVLSLIQYDPPCCDPDVETLARVDCGDYIRERILFSTTPDCRVPAYLLLPKGEPRRRPAVVALHDHGGFFTWGKEKLLAMEGESPTLTEYRRTGYAGRSIAAELARRGYVVMVIDAFYWGERRLLRAEDPLVWSNREVMTAEEVRAFDRAANSRIPLTSIGIFQAGITWAGVMLTDDMRTVDFLASHPAVDPDRIGCCGLSLGGFRTAWLAGMHPRIKAAVVVGWMCAYGEMLHSHVSSMGPMKVIPGLYQYLDLPDMASMTAPGGLMVIHGLQDKLFPNEGVQAAFEKMAAVYEKAGVRERFEGVTYDGPHEFNDSMQSRAFGWLDRWLRPERDGSL